ncbi:ATP-binding protein [Paraflavisolibacter sp. H34]|uniref:sensor histidine kinase n=1 Tax=Huijunlia imazamoxiresistens TaxID=3127457 RepID=UPI00301932AF
MNNLPVPRNLLIVEDNPGDFLLFKTYLEETHIPIGRIYHAGCLADVPELLKEGRVDLAFLDLSLPDGTGTGSFVVLNNLIPEVPIVVLSGLQDEAVALEAISLGAQDYLLKDDVNPGVLKKSVFYSLERKKSLQALWESNERFHALAKATHDAIWDWDLTQGTLWWNEGLRSLFGYDGNPQNLLPEFRYHRIHPADKERVIQSLQREIAQGGKNWSAEYRFQKADGTYAHVYDRAYTLFDEEGKPNRMVGSMMDVTASKMAEQALKKNAEDLEQVVQERTAELTETNEQLTKSNAELEQFAYVASHDLQEPLRKILLFSERLKLQTAQLPTAEGLLMKIETSAKRMSDLIKGLLDYSRLKHHSSHQEFVPVNLNKVLQNVLYDLEVRIQQKNARVEAEELPVIEAIELQMYQLFYNLVGNSLKFIPPDRQPHIRIANGTVTAEEIRQFRLPDEREYRKLVFSDNGIGFEQAFAEKIFDPFHRLHSREEYPGTGIGLALCQRVVENHQGRIRAEGQPGEGATFIVLLPGRHAEEG